jgi:predicted DNA-binding WGR domain protein
MERYYVLSVEPTFLGDTDLVREWGRIGQPGLRRVDLHAAPDGAQEALSVWLARKLRRGYVLGGDDRGIGRDRVCRDPAIRRWSSRSRCPVS